MSLLATLTLLRGMSYVHASISAFLIAAYSWMERPTLLLISSAFLAAAYACSIVYQRVIDKSIRTMMEGLDGRQPEVARSAARLLFMDGRDEEARAVLIKYLGPDHF